MTEPVHAVLDSGLRARIVGRRELSYADGAAPALDRPAHVRAASAIAWLGKELVIAQDDASFLAHVDVGRSLVRATPLQRGPAGARVFETARGNKQHKLDLEACFSTLLHGVPTLFAFGSGSSPVRETVVVLEQRADGEHVRVVRAARLYGALRAHPSFASTELNIEGAVLLGTHVRLFQRSNGAVLEGRAPHCATVELRWDALERWLAQPDLAALPVLESVRVYELGSLDGVRLTFTDACAITDSSVLFLASAEASPDATADGEVKGTAVGTISSDGSARYCLLEDEDGALSRDKAEGIVLARHDPRLAYVVFDPDDGARPATLAEMSLEGPWRALG